MDKEIAADIFKDHNSIEKYRNVGYTFYGERIYGTDVSIMIPTYKRWDLLVRGVQSAINQKTEYSLEIIIVDNDPGTDEHDIINLLSEINDFRVGFVRNDENIGMFGNWNRCIDFSHSNWLVILNDDDELEENYVENMMSCAESIPGCKALCCGHHLIDEKGTVIKTREYINNQNKIVPISLKDMYLVHPVDIFGCLLKKSDAIKDGGFNESFFPVSDAVFLIHMSAEKGLFLNTKKLFRYRWSRNESQKPATRIDFAKFHILKSIEINKKYGLYGNAINRFVVNSKSDCHLYPLVSEGIINKEDSERIRSELCVDKRYSPFRRFLFRIITRLYFFWFCHRNNTYPSQYDYQ